MAAAAAAANERVGVSMEELLEGYFNKADDKSGSVRAPNSNLFEQGAIHKGRSH